MSAEPWSRASFGGFEIPAYRIEVVDRVDLLRAAPLGRAAWRGSFSFELGADIVSGLLAAIEPPHPTDVIAADIRACLRSTIPAEVQRGIDLLARWRKRLDRREARSGTRGRRGARGHHEARES